MPEQDTHEGDAPKQAPPAPRRADPQPGTPGTREAGSPDQDAPEPGAQERGAREPGGPEPGAQEPGGPESGVPGRGAPKPGADPAATPDSPAWRSDLAVREPARYARGRPEPGRPEPGRPEPAPAGYSGWTPPPGGRDRRPDDRPPSPAAVPPAAPADRSVGTRICFLLAALLLVLAGYLLLAPLERPSSQGPPFGCGTALHPPSDSFARAVCGGLNRQHAMQSGAVAAGAVVLAGGGLLAFGPIRRRRGRWRRLRPGEWVTGAPVDDR